MRIAGASASNKSESALSRGPSLKYYYYGAARLAHMAGREAGAGIWSVLHNKSSDHGSV